MSLSGAMCSVMMYSNLALGATNNVTLEFSTPHGIAPDGVLLCATALDHRFDRSTFVVNALEEGGSQFLAGVSQTVAGATDALTIAREVVALAETRVDGFGGAHAMPVTLRGGAADQSRDGVTSFNKRKGELFKKMIVFLLQVVASLDARSRIRPPRVRVCLVTAPSRPPRSRTAPGRTRSRANRPIAFFAFRRAATKRPRPWRPRTRP